MIDLHGLHVREALSILGDEIAQLTSRNGRPPSKVAVLVGTGHYTKARFALSIQYHMKINKARENKIYNELNHDCCIGPIRRK